MFSYICMQEEENSCMTFFSHVEMHSSTALLLAGVETLKLFHAFECNAYCINSHVKLSNYLHLMYVQ